MKRLFILSILSLVVAACNTEEIGPDISFNDNTAKDTTYVSENVPDPQPKHVLVEESTGVKCPNCPKGAQILKDLDASYDGKLDIISIHYGGEVLNEPHPLNPDLDLRPDAQLGKNYISLLGGNQPQPAASVDRQLYKGKLLNSRLSWSSQISDRFGITTPVNIELKGSTDVDKEQLIIDMKLTYTSDQTSAEEDFYSIALLENDIEGVQDSLGYALEDYIFEDVFRTFVTPLSGQKITAERVAGRVIEKTIFIPFSDLKSDWNQANLVAIVFVHKSSSTDLTVLQSQEVHF